MPIKTFRRGIHPADGKALSMNAPITPVRPTPGGESVYPLSQHIGAPAVPAVNPGDHVNAGQLLARAGGFVSAPLYASASGTVVGIEPRTTTSGETAPCLVIRNDDVCTWENPAHDPYGAGAYDPAAVDAYMAGDTRSSLTPDTVLNAVRDAGVVGLGGAGFPTAVKLAPKNPDAIDCLIVNGAECEPYLTSDYRLMLERGEALIAGCVLLLTLFPKARCVIGIENNKPAAIAHVSSLLKKADDARISVVPLRAKYPQGGERMLIHAVTGRRLNSSMLPADAGCVVMNAATVIAAYFAIAEGRPLTHRIMTITGDGVAAPCNVEVPVGISYREVLAAAGGFAGTPEKVITGGPMMGTALFSLDLPVTKTSASVLALSRDPVALHDTTPCVHCGKCLRACPEGLVPQLLSAAADRDEFDVFEKYGGMECIECGSCAYVCPAKRHLVQSMRYGKRMTGGIIRARKQKEAEAKAAAQTAGTDAAANAGTAGKGGSVR